MNWFSEMLLAGKKHTVMRDVARKSNNVKEYSLRDQVLVGNQLKYDSTSDG